MECKLLNVTWPGFHSAASESYWGVSPVSATSSMILGELINFEKETRLPYL